MPLRVLDGYSGSPAELIDFGYYEVFGGRRSQVIADPLVLSFTPPIYSDPDPVIVSVLTDPDHLLTFTGKIGPVISDSIPFPEVVYFWQVDFVPGEFSVFIDETYPVTFTTRETIVTSFTIPFGVNLNGKYLRLGVRARFDYSQVFYSAAFYMSGLDYDNSVFRPQRFPSPLPVEPLQEVIGKPGPGVFIPTERDFSSRNR